MSNLYFTLFEQRLSDRTINLTNLESTKPYETFYTSRFGIDVRKIILSSDESIAVILSVFDSLITVLDLENLERKVVITNLKRAFNAVISNDKNYLYALCALDYKLYKIPINNQNESIETIRLTSFESAYYPQKLVIDSTNNYIYCAGNTNKIDVINVGTFTVVNTLDLGSIRSSFNLSKFEISQSDEYLVYANRFDNTIKAIFLNTEIVDTLDLTVSHPNIKIFNCLIDQTSSFIYVLGLNLKDTLLLKISTSGNLLTLVDTMSFNDARITQFKILNNELYLLNTKNQIIEKVNLSTFALDHEFNLNMRPYYITAKNTNAYAVNKNSGKINDIDIDLNTIGDISKGVKYVSYFNSGNITYGYDFGINQVQVQSNFRGSIYVTSKKTNPSILFALNKKQNNYIINNIDFVDNIGNPVVPTSIVLLTSGGDVINSFTALDTGRLSLSLPRNFENYILKATGSGSTAGMLTINANKMAVNDISVQLIENYYSQQGTITGTVTDSTENLILDAIVQIFKISNGITILERVVTTDINGEFSVNGLKNGNYKIIVNKKGFISTTNLETIVSSTPVVSNFNLATDLKVTKTLSGTAYLNNGAIAAGVVVKLTYYNENNLIIIQDITTSNSSGNFSFSNVSYDKKYFLEGNYWY